MILLKLRIQILIKDLIYLSNRNMLIKKLKYLKKKTRNKSVQQSDLQKLILILNEFCVYILIKLIFFK